jgi:hypothetical protein
MVLRVRAESRRAECKCAERHSAEPNVTLSTLHSVELIGLLFFSDNYPLRGVFI